ncbi:MAG: hypothetical protein Q8P05_03505 [Candidatus Diapherotrites archaeon]|nr:hypothetical protein [Candidatus Diapherotrites archaeon]
MHPVKSTRAVVYSPYPLSTPGAAGMRAFYFLEALRDKGVEVSLLTPRDAMGIYLIIKIMSLRPNVVIATSPPLTPTFFTWIGARLTGAIWVLDAKEDGHAIKIQKKEKRNLKEKLFLGLRQFLYERTNRIWFLTQSDKVEATSTYFIHPSRIQWVPNGVDGRIHFNAKKRLSKRKKWNIPPRGHVIIYAGSIGDEDVTGLIDHFPLGKKNLYLALVLAHETTPEDLLRLKMLKDKIREKSIGLKVIIEQNVPIEDMSAILSASDTGVIPWRDELPTSLPVKVYDYAGAGLPIVAKCPRDGELEKFLQQNPKLGRCESSWENFSTVLEKAVMTKLSPSQRERLGDEAHNRWSRIRIAEEAIASLLPAGRHAFKP